MSKMKNQEMHSIKLPIEAIFIDDDFNARYKVENKEGEEEYEDIKSLAQQMKRDGQLSPVLVRKLAEDQQDGIIQYELIYGFRRIEALRSLDNQTVMACIWQGDDTDAYFVNLAENVARKNLKAWEKAERYAYLKSELEISGREIARRLGENSGHVNNLIRIMEDGNPKIIELFKSGHGKATTDALTKKVIKKDMTHEEQWEAWLKHCGLEEDLEGEGDEGEGEEAPEADPDKIRRPSMKHLEGALDALKDSDKDEDFVKGARAALKWAAAKTKTLPGIYNPAKPPKAEPVEAAA